MIRERSTASKIAIFIYSDKYIRKIIPFGTDYPLRDYDGEMFRTMNSILRELIK